MKPFHTWNNAILFLRNKPSLNATSEGNSALRYFDHVEATLAQDDNEMEIFSTNIFQWRVLPWWVGWKPACGSPFAPMGGSTAHQPYLHSSALRTTRAVNCSLYLPLSGTGDEKLLQNLFVTLKLSSQVSLYMASSVLHGQGRWNAIGSIRKGGLEFPWSSSLLLPSLPQ